MNSFKSQPYEKIYIEEKDASAFILFVSALQRREATRASQLPPSTSGEKRLEKKTHFLISERDHLSERHSEGMGLARVLGFASSSAWFSPWRRLGRSVPLRFPPRIGPRILRNRMSAVRKGSCRDVLAFFAATWQWHLDNRITCMPDLRRDWRDEQKRPCGSCPASRYDLRSFPDSKDRFWGKRQD